MSWSTVATTVVALFTVGVTCLPMEVPATDFVPPPAKTDNGPTLATDLMPPPLPESVNEKKKSPAMLFIINVVAVKNSTAEDSNDVLHSDVIEEVPSEVAVPLALFLLVIEDENENHPVSLDDVARDLEKEGFIVEKVVKDGETRLVKVDVDTVETTVQVPEGSRNPNSLIDHETEIQNTGKLTSVRRKRHICLHCKLEEIKEKLHSPHHGGGCGGGCGGGYYIQPVYQPAYQPVYQQPRPQPYYPPQQPYYPQQPTCNTCGGDRGGYGNGGGNAYAQATAQASASSSSGGYGR